MPSPFPGMDPFLEAPYTWPDVHKALASAMRGELNRNLPAPYYAKLEVRPELGIVEEEERHRIVPDVTVVRSSRDAMTSPPARTATAVLEKPRTTASPGIEFTLRVDPGTHPFIEIRDPSRGHHLITLIEIVSPSNKRRGADRDAFLKKQAEVLDSDANLVVIDLIRAAERPLVNIQIADLVAKLTPTPDYLVLVSRAARRVSGELGYTAYPFTIRDTMPVIPVPLRAADPDCPLDLQFCFNRAYDEGPYRRGAVDYDDTPPPPPLPPSDAPWMQERLSAFRCAGR